MFEGINKTLPLIISLCIFASCGKNAQIEADDDGNTRVVTPVTGDDLLEFDSQILDLGKVLINNTIQKMTTVTNTSNQVIQIKQLSSAEHFKVVQTDCIKSLEAQESCSVTVEFSPKEVKDYSSKIKFDFSIGNSQASTNLDTLGEGILRNTPNDDLNPAYNQLNADQYNYGELGIGSTYVKYVFLHNTGEETVTIDSIRSNLNSEVSIQKHSNTEGSCFFKQELEVGEECFLTLEISPLSAGSKANYFYVDYSPLDNRESKTLPLKATYSAKTKNECINASERLYLTKNENELTPYELGLEFPYKFRTSDGTITLQRVINTDHTNVRSYLEDHDIFYVTDSQVFFSFGLRLTPNRSVIGTRVLIDGVKSGAFPGPHYDTELLCNNDMKRCSGKYFVDPNMTDLITNKFTIMNKFFSNLMFTLPVIRDEFLYLSDSFDLLSTLGMRNDEVTNLVDDNASLSFTVTDDIRLNKTPKLLIEEAEIISCAE